jgi:hypothetical protein
VTLSSRHSSRASAFHRRCFALGLGRANRVAPHAIEPLVVPVVRLLTTIRVTRRTTSRSGCLSDSRCSEAGHAGNATRPLSVVRRPDPRAANGRQSERAASERAREARAEHGAARRLDPDTSISVPEDTLRGGPDEKSARRYERMGPLTMSEPVV